MYHEIDRKFLVQKMPNLKALKPVLHERYYLQHGDLIEERIEKVGNVYGYEMKKFVSPKERTREKRKITKTEFNNLKDRASKVILRESYLLSKKNPRISIKKYKGEYRGLVFVEVEFDTKEDSELFKPLLWMGPEITNSSLGRDCWLLDLDREHFLRVLSTETDKLHIDFLSVT